MILNVHIKRTERLINRKWGEEYESWKIIAIRNAKTIYCDENNCVKVFNKEYSKADILNEALNQARVEELPINVPKIKEVTMIDGKWAIITEYIKGYTLLQLMENIQKRKINILNNL